MFGLEFGVQEVRPGTLGVSHYIYIYICIYMYIYIWSKRVPKGTTGRPGRPNIGALMNSMGFGGP